MIKINGVEIPTPSDYTMEIMDLSTNAERTASGLLVRDIVAKKRKILLRWNYLSKENLSFLLSTVSPSFFNVEYINPETNQLETGEFYAGDRKAGAIDYRNGVIRYKDISFNIIER